MRYISELDREHAIRKLAYHRLVARYLRRSNGDELHKLALDALVKMEASHNGTYILPWKKLMARDRMHIANEIIKRNSKMETMRESSPFMSVFGFNMGKNMEIVFRDEKTRSRMWKLARKVGKINKGREPELEEENGTALKF